MDIGHVHMEISYSGVCGRVVTRESAISVRVLGEAGCGAEVASFAAGYMPLVRLWLSDCAILLDVRIVGDV